MYLLYKELDVGGGNVFVAVIVYRLFSRPDLSKLLSLRS